MDLNILLTWSSALIGGAMGGLAVSQAVTGRPTIPMVSRRIKWSVGELKILGLGWAIFWTALAVIGLAAGLNIAAHRIVLFLPLTLWPILIGGPIFQLVMEQHHNRLWPFKDRVSRT